MLHKGIEEATAIYSSTEQFALNVVMKAQNPYRKALVDLVVAMISTGNAEYCFYLG